MHLSIVVPVYNEEESVGPLLDRFDLFVNVPALSPAELTMANNCETSSTVHARVEGSRDFAANRLDGYGGAGLTNAEVGSGLLEETTNMDNGARDLLADATKALGLSARAYHKIQRVSRTIADLEKKVRVNQTHISEALSYRRVRPGKNTLNHIGLNRAKGAA